MGQRAGSIRLAFVAALVAFAPIAPTRSHGEELPCGRNHWNWRTASFAGEAAAEADTEIRAGRYTIVLERIAEGWHLRLRTSGNAPVALFATPQRPVRFDPLAILPDRLPPGLEAHGSDGPPPLRVEFQFGRLATDPTANPELVAPANAESQAPDVMPVEGDAGRGEFVVDEYKLAESPSSGRAAFASIRFHGCLEWNPGYRETALARTAPQRMNVGWLVAALDACGVDGHVHHLSERMAVRGQRGWLEPDLDGDGHNDLVVPMTRVAGGEPGLAICLRKDRKLVYAGFGRSLGDTVAASYFAEADWWEIDKQGTAPTSGAENPTSDRRGDGVILGIEGASSVRLHLDPSDRIAASALGD